MSYSFDELSELEDSKTARNPRPFWAINHSDEREVIKWLMGEFNYLSEDSRGRIDQIHKNFANYKGLQYDQQSTKTSSTKGAADENKTKVSKIVVNNLYDLTESHVSRAVKYRPAVSVSPSNSGEFNDTVAAKMTKALLDHIWYEKNFREGIFPEIVRDSRVAGEDYLFIGWNKDLGDEHPAYKEKSSSGKQVSIMTTSGEEIKLSKPVRIGDVDYERVCADSVLLQKKKKFEEIEYCFRIKHMNIDEIRALYPEKSGSIKPDLATQIYDYDSMELKKMHNEALLIEFYHKPTENFKDGIKVCFIKDMVLHSENYPYQHKMLPFVRMADITLPNERHAISFFHNIRPMTAMYNNVTNMIVRNQLLVSHPKWIMPAGAAKLESLGNDITIVQYKGAVAPQLVSVNPTPPEVFTFRKELKEEFQTLSGVHGVSRGEPPPGVKAGVAMSFLNEQENERSNNFMLKVNEFIRLVALQTVSVAGQYYKPHDQRMIKIQGKNNEWMTKRFDPQWISTSFDIRVANSSALPESKSQRTQNILDINQGFPGIFSNEQVLEMLDLANFEKLVDSATLAVRSAEAENSDMMDGEQVLPPEEYENHVLHWRVHSRIFQSAGFKSQPEEIKKIAKDHMIATEMMMFEHAKKNPLFAGKLKELDMFPMFYFDESMIEEVAPPMGVQPNLPPVSPKINSGGLGELGQDLGNPGPDGQALIQQ